MWYRKNLPRAPLRTELSLSPAGAPMSQVMRRRRLDMTPSMPTREVDTTEAGGTREEAHRPRARSSSSSAANLAEGLVPVNAVLNALVLSLMKAKEKLTLARLDTAVDRNDDGGGSEVVMVLVSFFNLVGKE